MASSTSSRGPLCLLALALSPTVAAGCGSSAPPEERHAEPTPHGHPQHGHQHRFDDPAAYAAAWESPERDAWQQPAVLVASMGIEPGMRVADVGTGTGYLLRYLSEAAGPSGHVYAIDVERSMVDWVAERARTSGWANVEPVLAPTTGPGVPDGSLDRAVMVNVFHHIEQRELYAHNLLRALAPGGSVLIVETRLDAPDGPPMHFRMPPERVMEVLEGAGFEVALSTYGNSRQYAVLGTRPGDRPRPND